MGNQQSSGGGDIIENAVSKGLADKKVEVDELTKVTAYLTDDAIKQLCGNPSDINGCVIRYVKLRAIGRDALKLDPINSELTKKVPPGPLYKWGQSNVDQKANTEVGEVAMKTATMGYCAEGSVCGAPVLGRPLWVWLLALFVILIAVYGLKRN
jgi:hypothetical protein